MESEFPSNANAKKGPEKKAMPEKKVEPIVSGKVIQRKKSLGKRFKETFFTGADTQSVAAFVLLDVALPAVKDLIADMVSQGVERSLFGEARSISRRGRGGYGASTAHTAYNRMSQGSRSDIFRREDPRAPSLSRKARAKHDFGEIVLETRVEAVAVLDQMYELISKYDVATVADLLELCDFTPEFTDQKYGWTDLRGSDVVRVHDGYLLELPRPEPLD